MKRAMWGVAWIAVLSLGSAYGGAQNAASGNLTDTAIYQGLNERLEQLSAMAQDLAKAQSLLQKQVNQLSDELQTLQTQQAQASANSVKPADLAALAKQLQEIDAKRQADKKLILDRIDQLAKTWAAQSLPAVPMKVTPTTPSPNPEQNGYSYKVKAGNTLSQIIAAYQKHGVKVTYEQVLKANKGLKPDLIQPGQVIFIPDPNAKK